MTNPEAPPVRVGQVWADNDKRMGGRMLRVVEIVSFPAIGQRRSAGATRDDAKDPLHAKCEPVVTAAAAGRFNPITYARPVYIRLDRFRPTASGYRLIADDPDPQPPSNETNP